MRRLGTVWIPDVSSLPHSGELGLRRSGHVRLGHCRLLRLNETPDRLVLSNGPRFDVAYPPTSRRPATSNRPIYYPVNRAGG